MIVARRSTIAVKRSRIAATIKSTVEGTLLRRGVPLNFSFCRL
jgi:hypothetical protein